MLLVALLAAAVVVAVLVGVPDLAAVRRTVERAGWLGPVVFVVGYGGATLAPVPKNVLSVAAGAVFGLVAGTALVLAGACLGAVTAFGLARVLGRESVQRLAGDRLDRVDDLLSRRGLVAVLLLRLVPVVPFTVVNYGAGLTGIRFPPYLLGTAVGILPGTVSFVALGRYGTRPWSWQFGAAAAALALLSLGGWLLARRHRRVSGAEG